GPQSPGQGDGAGKGDICNCFGKLNDPGKPALRRLGILPQQISHHRQSRWYEEGPLKGPLFEVSSFGPRPAGDYLAHRSADRDLIVNQPGRAHAAPSNPTASTEPLCLRVQQLSGDP